jgi:hypothetical protein
MGGDGGVRLSPGRGGQRGSRDCGEEGDGFFRWTGEMETRGA